MIELRGFYARSLCALGCIWGLTACGGGDSSPASKSGTKAHKGSDAGAHDGGHTSAQAASHGAWPMMGYDTKNNYFNPNEHTLSVDNAAQVQEKWRFEVAGFPPGSPIIAEGMVFVMATGGTYGIHLNDGSQAWMRDDIVGTASAAYADGFVYVHATTAELYKLNAKDGKTVWGPVKTHDHKFGDGESSPIVASGKVFVGHSTSAEVNGTPADQDIARGAVEAFNAADGTPAWTYYTVPESGENGAMVWSTVTVDLDANVVFAATGNNYTMSGEDSDAIHAIELSDGKRKWKQQVREGDTWTLQALIAGKGSQDTDFGANPILAEVDGKKIVADGDKGSAFWALDRETGAILWSRSDLSSSHTPANGGMLMNGAFDGKYFYVASNEPPDASQLHALDPKKEGADVWPPIKLGAIVWGAPSLANGLLVVPVGTVLTIYNASTGEMLNELETGGTIAAGAATIADGKIVVQSGLQYMYAPTAKNNNLVICYGL